MHSNYPALTFSAAILAAMLLSPANARPGNDAAASASLYQKEQATAPKTAPWEKDISEIEERDRKNPPPADAALFIGSSSIRLWETLAKDFPEIPVINHGFGGSEVADSAYFVDRLVVPVKPRIIVMYAGTNDVANGKSSQKVRDDFEAFVKKVRVSFPNVPIAYISINPSSSRIAQRSRVVGANRLIAEYTRTQPNLIFINSYDPMLGPDGLPQKSLLRDDGLHLNPAGYKRWTEIVKPTIFNLYRSTKPVAK